MEKDGLYLGGISFNVSKAETLSFGTFAILISEESAPYNPETSTFKVAIQSLPTVFETELYGIADIPAKYRSFVVKYAKEAF